MNHTLFISDLHLEPERPDITAWFCDFLIRYAPQADAVYILGDLFEVWVGNDHLPGFNQLIAQAVFKLKQQGIPIYFMPGNRDFLLDNAFAKQAGWQIMSDPTVIHLYGKITVLSHGDLLCTEDYKHQQFRRYTQNPRYNKYFLQLPLFIRRWVARLLRKASRGHTGRLSNTTMDVNAEAALDLMQRCQATQLIHGHTHRPHIHTLVRDEKSHQRIVLGDWDTRGNGLIYYADGRYELIHFNTD